MYWKGIEEIADRICKQYGIGEQKKEGLTVRLTVIDGGKKLVKDQRERKLYSDLTGWTVEPNSNLISVEVSRI